MIIDFHTHVMPPEMAAAPIWRGKCPMTIENVLEAAKEGGVDSHGDQQSRAMSCVTWTPASSSRPCA